jgi:hypothetical protein
MASYVSIAIWLLIALLAVTAWRQRRKRSLGPGAAGSVYDLLNQDRRAALEIVVEERTGYRDPEDRDGNLPELDQTKK